VLLTCRKTESKSATAAAQDGLATGTTKANKKVIISTAVEVCLLKSTKKCKEVGLKIDEEVYQPH